MDGRGCGRIRGLLLLLLLGAALQFLGRGLSVEKAALLDWASGLHATVVLLRMQEVTEAVVAADRAGQVGDILGHRVLAPHGARVDTVTLTGLAHGVIATVEVLALFQVLREMVAPTGQLAVEPEEPLLLWGERLHNSDSRSAIRSHSRCRRDRGTQAARRAIPIATSLGRFAVRQITYLDIDLLGLVGVHDCLSSPPSRDANVCCPRPPRDWRRYRNSGGIIHNTFAEAVRRGGCRRWQVEGRLSRVWGGAD